MLLTLALVPVGSSDSPGTGVIHCYLVMPFVSHPCDAEMLGADVPTLATGNVESVTLTISWVPMERSATELRLGLKGNTDCTSADVCAIVSADGPSPLSVTLTGDGASGITLQGSIRPTPVCRTNRLVSIPDIPPESDRIECDTPPVKLVQDQEFTYVWTVVK